MKRMANMLFDHVANAIEKSTGANGDQDGEESPPKKPNQSDWLKEAKSKFMKSLNAKKKPVQMIRRWAKAVSMNVLDSQRVVMFDSDRFTEDDCLHAMNLCGVDSDGSGALTTRKADAIGSLLTDDAEVMTQFASCVQYQTGNGAIKMLLRR